VLCAGVVQDPLLLWRSGIGPADAVRALGIAPVLDVPAVGAHMTDHFVMSFAAEVPADLAPDDAPTLQNILRATTEGGTRVHDLQLTPWVRRHPDGRRSLGISVSLQLPEGEGSVTPTSAGPDAPARIAWPFTDLPANVARLRDGWRLAARICAATGLVVDETPVRAALDASDRELDASIADEHTAFYHGVGTCGMGAWDDEASVVDPACNVRGVGRLRVIDASVIPTVPRANTNLVVTALAERAVALATT
jgi:choline dehydrogenase